MRRVLAVLAGLVLLGSVAVSATRFLTAGDRYLAALAAVSPYAVLGFLVVLVGCLLALALHRRGRTVVVLTVVAVLGVVAHASWLAPRFVADDAPPSDAPRVRVMTANLQYGSADPGTVVRAARSERLDLLVLEEITPYELVLLEKAGLRQMLPNLAGEPALGASGLVVLSRLPLSAPVRLPLGNGGLAVTVGRDGQGVGAFRLLAAHPRQPLSSAAGWVSDLGTLRAEARDAVREGPTVVAGDLNATLDHRLLRRVVGAGLTDAVDGAGSGWQPTWPNAFGFSWTRPVVTLDHVLSSRPLVAVRTRTLEVPGSDHLALVAVLARREAGADRRVG